MIASVRSRNTALVAAIAVSLVCGAVCWITPGNALEAGQSVEGSTATQQKIPRGALACAIEDSDDALTHVLLCRFDDVEDCVLTAPMPFKKIMQKFEEVKILGIGSTPEGCSQITFSGSLKGPR
jgi:hypothetical protein